MIDQPWITTIDDFLPAKMLEELIEESHHQAHFAAIHNEIDGVEYPLINPHIPPAVSDFIEQSLGCDLSLCFMRQSPEGVHVPQIHHHDYSMGKHSLMLYLCDGGAAQAGTAFVRHKLTGACYGAMAPRLVDLINQDKNNDKAWAVHAFCPAKQNRACLFDAGFYHRAEPIGGAGTGENARCVFTAFYD